MNQKLAYTSINAYKHNICEDATSPEVDGVHVLAKASGPAFFPETESGNGVFYTAKVWNKVLKDKRVLKLLEDRLMFGSVGHDVKLDDEAIGKGDASHIVIRMWVDEETGIGMAEYLVLNTDRGRNLNTLLRAGCKLRVSTKGRGNLIPHPKSNGSQVLQDDELFFQRIDFVVDPGYDDALPEVVESLNNLNSLENEGTEMNEALELLTKLLGEVNQQVNESKSENGTIRAQMQQVQESLTSVTATANAYQALGTVAEIQESLDKGAKATADLAALVEDLGTHQEISEAMGLAGERITDLTETVQEQASELHSKEGELKTIKESLDAYVLLGTCEEVAESLKKLDEAIEREVAESIAKLAETYSVSEAIVTMMAKANDGDFDKVEEALLDSVEEAKKKGKGKGKGKGDVEEEDEDGEDDVAESNRQRREALFGTPVEESQQSGNKTSIAKSLY